MVVSFLVDDGTGALRVVAFRDTAEKITTTNAGELSKLEPEDRYKLLSGSMVGKEYIIHGRVKKNEGMERLEMVADDVQNLNISEESEKLAEFLKVKLG
jgi:DNA/RNA endonuclease YhcR with UshA esterase domain